MFFLLAGQSNMRGLAPSKNINVKMPNIRYYDKSTTITQLGGKPTFGPEISFSKHITKLFPANNITIIKYALDGSSLYSWSPNWSEQMAQITEDPANYDNLFKKCTSIVNEILSGQALNAIFWMQGERDSRFKKAAQNYYKNFKLFINSLRGKYGQIPFIYGRISKFYQFGQAVREAQNKIVDELPLTQIINTDDLPKQNDGLHFNTEGLNKLGKRFANAYYRLKK